MEARHWKGRRAPGVAACLLVLALVSPGCGSEAGAVADYLDTATGVIDQLTGNLEKVREELLKPLAAQNHASGVLADFRRVISVNRDMLDRRDPPSACRELDGMLRTCLGRGQEVAYVAAGFTGLADQLSSPALKVEVLVDAVSTAASGGTYNRNLPDFQSRSRELVGQFQSAVVAPVFEPVREVMLEFTLEFNQRLSRDRGSSAAGAPVAGLPSAPGVTAGVYLLSGGKAHRDAVASGSRTASWAESAWAGTNQEVSGLIQQAMDTTGYNHYNALFDGAVIQATGKIGELQASYSPSKGP